MNPTQEYRRLPGRSGLLIRHSLWMKPDHLLRVRANPFSQQYRRYYFADIQALVLTELHGTAAFYWYAAAVSLGVLSGLLVNNAHPLWAALSGIFAVLAFYLGWRVPNCVCYLKTSVSTDKLPSLLHLSAARTAVPMVLVEIEKAQGALTRETLDTHQLPSSASVSFPNAPVPNSQYAGQLHWVLFGSMIFHAALSAIIFFMSAYSTPVNIIAGTTSAATLLFAILAAFKQHRSSIARSVRWVVYSTLILYVVDTIASFALSIYLTFQLAARGQKPGNQMAILNHPAFKILQVADLTWFLVLGCIGLILMTLHRRSTHTPPPLAVAENSEIQADAP
jgi:hypothetical protein